MPAQEPPITPHLPPSLLIFIIAFLSGGTVISHSHAADPQPPPAATHQDIRMWTWSDDSICCSGKGLIGDPARAFADSPDRNSLAVALGASIWIYDVETGSGLALPSDGHTTAIRSLAYSPDGLTIAAGTSNGVVQLWKIKSQRLLDIIARHDPDRNVDTLAFSTDGKTLASATRDEIKLWNIGTQAHLLTLRGFKDQIAALAFSPNGETLASRAEDDTVQLWEVATGKNLATFKYPRHASVAYVLATEHFDSAKTADKDMQKAAIERVIADFRHILSEHANTKYADLSLVQIGEAYMILADEEDKYLNDALEYFDKLWVKYGDECPEDAQVAKALRIAQSQVAKITIFMESNNILRRQTGDAE